MLHSERVIAVAPSGKWVGKEGFVAEAAVQFERIGGTIARLERELEKSRQTIAEMAEEASRNKRFQAFEVSVENSRDYKITDVQRTCRDLKARLDAIEGDRAKFANLTYKSFAPVDRRLPRRRSSGRSSPHAATRCSFSALSLSPRSRSPLASSSRPHGTRQFCHPGGGEVAIRDPAQRVA